ncbi:MAG: hypothetical protein KBB91_00575 [Candidatus Pacebacteria bacterium]|jgi:hypothetical protein|nr:hypothetical protein [Candidatus Paceibacterota bacterium]
MNPYEQDNISYLESTGSTTGREVVVSTDRTTNQQNPMENSTNKTLITIMIVIGIIIIILLLGRGYIATPMTYSYRSGNFLTASTIPLDGYTYQNADNRPGHYTITKRYTEPSLIITAPKSYSYTSYTTTPSYQYDYSYSQTTYPGETIFPDGCTLTSPYSLTTGEPCS